MQNMIGLMFFMAFFCYLFYCFYKTFRGLAANGAGGSVAALLKVVGGHYFFLGFLWALFLKIFFGGVRSLEVVIDLAFIVVCIDIFVAAILILFSYLWLKLIVGPGGFAACLDRIRIIVFGEEVDWRTRRVLPMFSGGTGLFLKVYGQLWVLGFFVLLFAMVIYLIYGTGEMAVGSAVLLKALRTNIWSTSVALSVAFVTYAFFLPAIRVAMFRFGVEDGGLPDEKLAMAEKFSLTAPYSGGLSACYFVVHVIGVVAMLSLLGVMLASSLPFLGLSSIALGGGAEFGYEVISDLLTLSPLVGFILGVLLCPIDAFKGSNNLLIRCFPSQLCMFVAIFACYKGGITPFRYEALIGGGGEGAHPIFSPVLSKGRESSLSYVDLIPSNCCDSLVVSDWNFLCFSGMVIFGSSIFFFVKEFVVRWRCLSINAATAGS
ncbi:hypothetical protein ACUH9H_04130 [Dermabacteraceae bacterium P13128]